MDNIPCKCCTKCGKNKPLTDFPKSNANKSGYRSSCKACKQDELRLWRSAVEIRTCAACGANYESHRGESRFCTPCGASRRMANLNHPEKMRLICKHCGVVFQSDRRSKQYCSNVCKRSALRGKTNAKRDRQYPHARRAVVHTCPGCGVEFRGVKDTKRKPQRYCSHTCYLKCRRVSHFEADVMRRLEDAGLTIERQARRGQWSFDGAIVGTSLLVEADGVFWHSTEKVKDRDVRKTAWAASQDLTVLRVLEMEYYADPVAALAPILRRAEAEGLTVERSE